MSINELIKFKSLPSFCTSNFLVLKILIKFCKKKKLPLLIETTSNQVNQFGGYTNLTPKKFIKKILLDLKKEKFNRKLFFYGGDHLGPLPWQKFGQLKSLERSKKLIKSYIDSGAQKIHIDTSIKLRHDKNFSKKEILKRTQNLFNNLNLDKINNIFFVFGTEVPFAGGGIKKNQSAAKFSAKSAINESDFVKKLLLKKFNYNKYFALVIDTNMEFFDRKIIKPNLKNLTEIVKYSKKKNFYFEAHSTDYQSLNTLKKLVKNNFKFLKVGPELTHYLLKSLFLMEQFENEHILKKNRSFFKQKLINEVLSNKTHWEKYYNEKDSTVVEKILKGKLDRARYYLNTTKVNESIKLLEKNINFTKKARITHFLNSKKIHYELDDIKKYKLNNFEFINFILLKDTLFKYFKACNFKLTN
jgi:D-tagatose-1,6-bisphosphate aldolase subunit GatZ/KbaZ